MTMVRSTGFAAGLVCAAFCSAALAGDISCLGVQTASATAKVKRLPEDQQQQFSGVLQFLQKTSAEAQSKMLAAERAETQDKQALVDANPGASKEEIDRLWREQIIAQGNADRSLAREVATQSDLHTGEAKEIAASSQIVTEGDRARMQEISDGYVTRNAAQLASIGSSPSLQRLISVMAASNAAAEGQDVAASAIASIGIDRATTDPTLATAGRLVRATIAVSAVGQRGSLRIDHVMTDDTLRDTQFRSKVIESEGETARQLRKVVAQGLNDGLVQRVVQRKIARIEPPSPTSSAARDEPSPEQGFVRAAKKAAASVTVIVDWAAPKIVRAVPKEVPAK